ncbi:hypothetical protein PTKIN_Ptkin14bG0156500 [Pterospermum kingtungense]
MPLGFCMAALRGPVETLVVEGVAKPAKRQFDYLCNFNKNVGKFDKQKEEMESARPRLEREVQMAENQLHEIEDDVRDVLSKVNDMGNDVRSMEQERQKDKWCFGWCPNWWWLYWLIKKLAKKEAAISELLNRMTDVGQPGRVGYPSTSTVSTIRFLLSNDFIVSKASEEAFKQIFEALEDDNVSMIGFG